MTAPKRLSARPVAFHPSRRRASARNSEVRLNADAALITGIRTSATGPQFALEPQTASPRDVLPCACHAPQTICHTLKSHK